MELPLRPGNDRLRSRGAPDLGDVRRTAEFARVPHRRSERNLGASPREHRLLVEREHELVGTPAGVPLAPRESPPFALGQVDAYAPARIEARRHQQVVAAEELV